MDHFAMKHKKTKHRNIRPTYSFKDKIVPVFEPQLGNLNKKEEKKEGE